MPVQTGLKGAGVTEMTNYEVWYTNENSREMEKCPTKFKSKERAQKYATTVEEHGYDTAILPWNYKSPKPKTTGEFGNHRMWIGLSHVLEENKTGGIYKSKRCPTDKKETERDLKYPPSHIVLSTKRITKPKGMPKYSASLMHRCKSRKR